ncbi:MAG: hypothetical protein ACLFPL_03090 [Candidatus Nanoarchaeia archaeon]
MDKEELYLKKIENDVNEKLYDLLIFHLQDVHKKFPRIQNNVEHLKTLNKHLFKALDDLSKRNKYNYLQYYRYSILIINTILSYKPNEKYLKSMKLSILNKFSSDNIYDRKEKIPLKSQMTELRITYDTSYLIYLVKTQFIPQKLWDKAMYCLIAIELVEPDFEELEYYKQHTLKHLHKEELEYKELEEPKGYTILLDTNIILSKVLYDVGEYRISHMNLDYYNSLIEKWGNNNTLIIPNSVVLEIKKHIDYSIEIITDVCSKFKHFDREEIVSTIQKRFDKILKKYAVKEQEDIEYDITSIEKFYMNYLGNLYEITLDKIHSKKLSQQLKKLSHRDGLLPEVGDMQLIADAIELRKTHDKVAILSNDKDLYLFNTQLEKEFDIRVYK